MSASVPTLVGGKPWEILQGDVRAVLKAMPDNYFDAVLSDPPYGLSFMGKRWDYFLPSVNVWTELLRVVKPGAHVMLFGGSLQAGWDEVEIKTPPVRVTRQTPKTWRDSAHIAWLRVWRALCEKIGE